MDTVYIVFYINTVVLATTDKGKVLEYLSEGTVELSVQTWENGKAQDKVRGIYFE